MVASTNLRPSLPFEQNLRKCFSTIHHGQSRGSPISPLRNDRHDHDGNGNGSSSYQHRRHNFMSMQDLYRDSQLKRDCGDAALRSQSQQQNRRHRAVHRRRAIIDTVSPCAVESHEVLCPPTETPPLPPFARSEASLSSKHQQQYQTSKYQRRHSPLVSASDKEQMRAATTNEKFLEKNRQSSSIPSSAAVGHQQQGFRKDYSLGRALHHPSHMINLPTEDLAVQAVSLLDKHDFVFIKRSDGSYSYAILAFRSVEPVKGREGVVEECLTFVTNNAGSTKMVRKRHWGQFVRLVAAENKYQYQVGEDTCHNSRPVTPPTINVSNNVHNRCPPTLENHLNMVLCQEVSPPAHIPLCIEVEVEDDWVPPNTISFESQLDEEMSLISSVSDKARMLRRCDLQQQHQQ